MKLKRHNTKSSKNQMGATMVEYAIMLGLISAISIPVISTLGAKVSAVFGNVNTQVSGLTQQQIQSTQPTSSSSSSSTTSNNSNGNGNSNSNGNGNSDNHNKGD
jgi:Flp pilus assembly pilin Flp